jgi:hypothetical protein
MFVKPVVPVDLYSRSFDLQPALVNRNGKSNWPNPMTPLISFRFNPTEENTMRRLKTQSRRFVSILECTLMAIGLLIPLTAGFAQAPDESVQSRIGYFKAQQARERFQDKGQKTYAPRVERAEKGDPVTVLQRAKLGNYIEDVDFIPSGPFANHIVFTAGLDVYGVPANANSDRAIKKLFNVHKLNLFNDPLGIAYIPSERLFAFIDPFQPELLVVCDHHGNPLPPRPIHYLGGFVPDSVEGLAYLPSTSALFPDHLLAVTYKFLDDFPFIACPLQVIRPDGQVVAEIPTPDDIAINLAASVAFSPPDRLLVTDFSNEVWTLDFAGNVVSGPVLTDLSAEGIVQLPDGRIVTGEGPHLRFFDAGLSRLPEDDRNVGAGPGLINPLSVAWNADTQQHVVAALSEEFPDESSRQVATVPSSLDSSIPIIDLGISSPDFLRLPRATYMQDEQRIAVALRRRGSTPAQIALYDDHGTLMERINISAIGGIGRPTKIDYIASTHEFVVVEQAQPDKLKILTRAGTFARGIDLSPIGIGSVSGVAYFNPLHPSGGQFLIFDSTFSGRAVFTDFNGVLMSEFNYRNELAILGAAAISAITTGPQAGAFAAISSGGSPELIVFRVK